MHTQFYIAEYLIIYFKLLLLLLYNLQIFILQNYLLRIRLIITCIKKNSKETTGKYENNLVKSSALYLKVDKFNYEK